MPVPYLPESAPFSPSQRAWLNGFFAGLTDGGGQPLAASQGNGAVAAPEAAVQEPEDEDFPWHDDTLPMDERLALADGKPKERVLMAAMAQLDCGQCGYLCKTYAEAIADGSEPDLKKCVPGGRETSKKLKELVNLTVETKPMTHAVVPPGGTPPLEQIGGGDAANGSGLTTSGRDATVAAHQNGKADYFAKPQAAGFDRKNPFPARLLDVRRLNRPDSAKDVRHVELGLRGSGLTYNVGDALGVYPENCPDAVHAILDRLGATGAEDVPGVEGEGHTSIYEALLRERTITAPTESLVDLLVNTAGDVAEASDLRAVTDANDGEVPEGWEVLDVLRKVPSARPPLGEFAAALAELQPRLYSISSSPKAHPGEVHLTVGTVRYSNPFGRTCKGVASTFFADRLRPGMKVRTFVNPSHGFAPPADGAAAMIMVGPGTGIAPFRAFLEERRATAATGKNWLFFGDQRGAMDFLYREELETYQSDGHLHRLDTAFSRDQAEKVYVQTRMKERAADLWKWLEEGAHFYVCGDAKRMAKDVDAALREVVAEQGGMDADAAKAYVKDLTRQKRYQRDVY